MARAKHPRGDEVSARSRANLRPAPPAPRGNQRHRVHGGYATIAADRLEGRARLIFDALAADAPMRDNAGELPSTDAGAVLLLAQALLRLEDVATYLGESGFDPKQLSILDLEGRLRREALALMTALGLTPTARAKLGATLVQVDLATAMSEPDAKRRKKLLEQAGVLDA